MVEALAAALQLIAENDGAALHRSAGGRPSAGEVVLAWAILVENVTLRLADCAERTPESSWLSRGALFVARTAIYWMPDPSLDFAAVARGTLLPADALKRRCADAVAGFLALLESVPDKGDGAQVWASHSAFGPVPARSWARLLLAAIRDSERRLLRGRASS